MRQPGNKSLDYSYKISPTFNYMQKTLQRINENQSVLKVQALCAHLQGYFSQWKMILPSATPYPPRHTMSPMSRAMRVYNGAYTWMALRDWYQECIATPETMQRRKPKEVRAPCCYISHRTGKQALNNLPVGTLYAFFRNIFIKWLHIASSPEILTARSNAKMKRWTAKQVGCEGTEIPK